MKTDTITEPAYVNLQPTVVMVPGPDRRNVTIHPWKNRNRTGGGTFVVYGAHYRQFVSGAGPLYPFPGDRRWLEQPGMGNGRGVDAGRAFSDAFPEAGTAVAASPGVVRASGDVVRDGKVVSETKAEIYAKIRQQLVAIGVKNSKDFLHAPAALLLSAPHVNENILPRLREEVDLLFPPAPAPKPAPVEEALADLAPPAVDSYAEADLKKMTKAQLVEIVEAEEFDLDAKSMKKADLLETLCGALDDYGLLTWDV